MVKQSFVIRLSLNSMTILSILFLLETLFLIANCSINYAPFTSFSYLIADVHSEDGNEVLAENCILASRVFYIYLIRSVQWRVDSKSVLGDWRVNRVVHTEHYHGSEFNFLMFSSSLAALGRIDCTLEESYRFKVFWYSLTKQMFPESVKFWNSLEARFRGNDAKIDPFEFSVGGLIMDYLYNPQRPTTSIRQDDRTVDDQQMSCVFEMGMGISYDVTIVGGHELSIEEFMGSKIFSVKRINSCALLWEILRFSFPNFISLSLTLDAQKGASVKCSPKLSSSGLVSDYMNVTQAGHRRFFEKVAYVELNFASRDSVLSECMQHQKEFNLFFHRWKSIVKSVRSMRRKSHYIDINWLTSNVSSECASLRESINEASTLISSLKYLFDRVGQEDFPFLEFQWFAYLQPFFNRKGTLISFFTQMYSANSICAAAHDQTDLYVLARRVLVFKRNRNVSLNVETESVGAVFDTLTSLGYPFFKEELEDKGQHMIKLFFPFSNVFLSRKLDSFLGLITHFSTELSDITTRDECDLLKKHVLLRSVSFKGKFEDFISSIEDIKRQFSLDSITIPENCLVDLDALVRVRRNYFFPSFTLLKDRSRNLI